MRRLTLSLLSLALPAVVGGASELSAQSLQGSRASVKRMYSRAVDRGLHFYRTPGGVERAARAGRFERLSGSAHYGVDGARWPYAVPTTRVFVERLGEQMYESCGERLVVTSALRPRSRQPRNASPHSVHPTGIAVDLRRPKTNACRRWLRSALLGLERAGVVEATEERRPPHFHVAVFPVPYARHVQRLTGERPPVAGAGGARVASAASGTTYRVRRGDSLSRIAARHRTTVRGLMAANGLRSTTLQPGQRLRIPAGG